MTVTYDDKCYELAASLLSDRPHLDTPGRVISLAAEIQQTIEDFIAETEGYREEELDDVPRGGEGA